MLPSYIIIRVRLVRFGSLSLHLSARAQSIRRFLKSTFVKEVVVSPVLARRPGMEKLVKAIDSIQADFEKVIVITHIEMIKIPSQCSSR